jgi:GMP synthase (glutamine-hydrolysing)
MTAPTAKRPLVIVKTGEPVPRVAERRGQFADLIRDAIGPAFRGDHVVVDVREGPPPDPRGAAAFVITGSAANVPTRDPWILRVEAWLRDVVAAGTPTFGICFGHQLLAQALGGEVQKNPRGREMGTVRVDRAEPAGADPIFADLPPSFEANATHVDTVIRLPPGAVPLARSDRDDYQAIRFSETCYSVQFHPEFDAEVMRAYIETRREILRGEGFDVDAMLASVTSADPGKQPLRRFVERFLR